MALIIIQNGLKLVDAADPFSRLSPSGGTDVAVCRL
jgi:hypothetical protein